MLLRFQKTIVLVGAHRVGASIAFNLKKEDLLIIEIDPDVLRDLKRRGFTCILGDIIDDEVREQAHLQDAKLVISTSPELEDNLLLVTELKRFSKRPKIIT